MAGILADPELTKRLVEIGLNRFQASADYMTDYHDKWNRVNKIYSAIEDAVEDSDEPNTGVAYAYGIIEDMVSKVVEPILQMKPPCRVAPRRAAHEKKSENFSAMCSTYFRTSRYQLEYTTSTRELCITGNTWEQDCWHAEYDQGRIWKKVKVGGMVDGLRSILGKVLPAMAAEHEAPQEVPHDIPRKVGYGTRFPNLFRVFPEPHVNNVRDMHWLIEEEPAVALDDLKKRTFVDPATGERRSFFDFTSMESVMPQTGGTVTPEPVSRSKSSAEDDLRDARGDQSASRAEDFKDDIDRVSLLWIWEPDRVWVIAQGRFLVAYQENVFQTPRIPYRLKVYTPLKDYLFGTGVIEPVEHHFYELGDIHKMSMRNWVRIINRMVAFDEDSIPYEDDFEPSALGRIRVRPVGGRSVAESIVPINHSDVTPSMLTQESNTKGIIERATAGPDFAPGAEGTKQTHKTLGGLMEIQRQVALRITTIRRMLLAAYQDQMWFMEKLHSQFLMDKMPFTVYGPDGSTAIQEFDLWDIHTDGAGFDFIIEYDPAFGDDQIRRNQEMALQNLNFQYIMQVKSLGLKDAALPDVEYMQRRIYQSFGWSDTSKAFKRPDGSMSPDEEIQSMLAGDPVAPKPTENLLQHIAEHALQLQMIAPLIASGKIDPRVGALLQAHLMATRQMAAQLLANPQPLVMQLMQEKGLGPQVPGVAATTPPAPPRPGAGQMGQGAEVGMVQ